MPNLIESVDYRVKLGKLTQELESRDELVKSIVRREPALRDRLTISNTRIDVADEARIKMIEQKIESESSTQRVLADLIYRFKKGFGC